MEVETVNEKFVGLHEITFSIEDEARGIESLVDTTITIEIIDPCAPQEVLLTSFTEDAVTYELRDTTLVYLIEATASL